MHASTDSRARVRDSRLGLGVSATLALLAMGIMGAASSCGGDSGNGATGDDAGDDGTNGETLTSDTAPTSADAPTDGAETGPTACSVAGLTPTSFAAGPYGAHRGDLADEVSLPLTDGSTWSLKDQWTGCESYVFLTDLTTISSTNSNPAWGVAKDLAALVTKSPKNVHYFFVSAASSTATANTNIANQDKAINAYLATLSGANQAFWKSHLHVVAKDIRSLGAWFSTPVLTYMQFGFAIDPRQHIRAVGTLADVTRPDGSWFANNIAYAASEADYMNADAIASNALDAESGLTVTVFDEGISHLNADGTVSTSAVLSQWAETDTVLPSAAQIAGYDTLEVEVTQRCPKADTNELASNCGAWDYIAFLGVAPLGAPGGDAGPDASGDARADADADGGGSDASADAGASDASADAGASDASAESGSDGGDAATPPLPTATPGVEIARFITSYHRETHWVVDATPMLTELQSGGSRHFHWEFAPPWNVQPTWTKLSLHFSNKKKPARPTQAIPLFTGGPFDSKYNTIHPPVTATIPATAKRVEIWAVITGHGGDSTTNCAEFCDHQHQFTVGSTVYAHEFAMAGTETGCVVDTANLMTPNQGGTWWYGRGGWCPGAPVVPWSVDVTKDAVPGTSVTVSYKGLLGGATPPDGTGNIDMNSYLVVYE